MLTGDKALSILAKKIKSQLKNEDLAFKSFGSEFIIFLDSKNQNLNQMAEEISRLTKSLQFDSEIIEIYQNQISSLEIELKAEKSEPRRQQLTNSISEIRTMIERPVVDAKLLSGDVNEKFLELNL
jgi:GGDEF domain-containing protein